MGLGGARPAAVTARPAAWQRSGSTWTEACGLRFIHEIMWLNKKIMPAGGMETSLLCLRNMFLVLSKPKNGVKVVYVIYGMLCFT